MHNLALVFFVSAELCYYLIIVQTGIIEYFLSDLSTIFYLPIGGILGSLLSFYLRTTNHIKIFIFLFLQLFISFLYPNLSSLMLFILGVSVGGLSPLVINELKKSSQLQIGLSLSFAYILGTLLFNTDVSSRDTIAIFLTLICIISLFFIKKTKVVLSKDNSFSLLNLSFWVFIDASLFETLSRDESISIWRDGYTYEIIIFHIIGILVAFKLQLEDKKKEVFILVLFVLSYLCYFTNEPLLLSIIYPIAISYYNIIILQWLINQELKVIAFSMIFIGWIGSGGGLLVALENLISLIPILLILFFINKIYQMSKFANKEI